MASRDHTMKKELPQSPQERAAKLGLYGLLARWDELGEESWVERLLEIEEGEALDRLLSLELVDHRPWSRGSIDGVWQLLPVPARHP